MPAAKVGDGVLWKRGNSEVGVRCRHGARKGIDKWHHAITAEPVAGQVAEVGGLLKMELLATKVFAVEANAVTEFPFNRDARSRAADERPHCKKAKAFTVEVQAVVAVSGLAMMNESDAVEVWEMAAVSRGIGVDGSGVNVRSNSDNEYSYTA